MLFRTIIIRSVIFSIFLPFFCSAEIKYISLHDVESRPQQPLTVKLNIVEQNANRLHFTLVNQNVESHFAFERLNNYMLRLKSPLKLIGDGAVKVYELNNNAWMLIKTIPLMSAEMLETKTNSHSRKPLDLQPNKIKGVVPVKQGDIADMVTGNKVPKLSIGNNCQLTKELKETLWSVASRYKDSWKVDVFGAMVAIYHSNLSRFTHQNIGLLMQGSTLNCPSNKMLSNLADKEVMRDEYKRLINAGNKVIASSSSKLSIRPSVASACQLSREPKETLWNIASRYKERWKVDVFGAMIAIYNSNLPSFTNQHIGFLRKDSVLRCPSNETLLNLGNKEAMRAEYIRLNSSLE